MSSTAFTDIPASRISLRFLKKKQTLPKERIIQILDISNFIWNSLKSSSFMSMLCDVIICMANRNFTNSENTRFWMHKTGWVIWLLVHALFNTTSYFPRKGLYHDWTRCATARVHGWWASTAVCVFRNQNFFWQGRSHQYSGGMVQKKHCPSSKSSNTKHFTIKAASLKETPMDVLNYSQKNWGL